MRYLNVAIATMAMAIIMPVTARRIMAAAQPTKIVFMSENNKKPRN
jgi:hypothetical protein